MIDGSVDEGSVPSNLPSGIRLRGVIATGGSSVLWRARDRRSGRDVAVKVLRLPHDAEGRERVVDRFSHEMRALARLSHVPTVLDVRSAGSDARTCWLVTALATGDLLSAAPLATEDLLVVAGATADALAAAHRLDVVHGDVTPANVVWVDEAPVLADFGLAVLQVDSAADAARGATPGWAAPERWEQPMPTPASDVYGWGATIWTAATGERPSGRGLLDVTALPRGLDRIVAGACEPQPGDRPSAVDLAAAVAAERRRRDRYCPDP